MHSGRNWLGDIFGALHYMVRDVSTKKIREVFGKSLYWTYLDTYWPIDEVVDPIRMDEL